jgi:hypothetical protein
MEALLVNLHKVRKNDRILAPVLVRSLGHKAEDHSLARSHSRDLVHTLVEVLPVDLRVALPERPNRVDPVDRHKAIIRRPLAVCYRGRYVFS